MHPASPSGPARPCHHAQHPTREARSVASQSAAARSADRPGARLEALLTQLGPQLRRGDEAEEPPPPSYPTGIAEIDQLLGGGFPGGRLHEITGPPSSGRTSLALALLARTTHTGQLTALVDPGDAFDPPSAKTSGVDLGRVLWARAGTWRKALHCTQRLLEAEGFPLVLLDLPLDTAGPVDSTTIWLQLSRLAAGTRTTLVVLSRRRCTGSHAEVTLEMQPTCTRFTGAPALLEELETQAVLVRHRTGPALRTALLRLRVSFAA